MLHVFSYNKIGENNYYNYFLNTDINFKYNKRITELFNYRFHLEKRK